MSPAPAVTGRFAIGWEDEPGRDFIILDEPIDFLERNAWRPWAPTR